MTAPHPRTARPGAGLRILRAAVFAAVCVVLAAAGHTLASCARVPLWTLGAGFLGSLLLVAPLAGRARSLPGIAALLALGQTVLHTLFGLGQHGVAGAMPTGSADTSLSNGALVERAARLLCGSSPSALTPGHAYRLLVDAHLIDPSGRAVGAMPAMQHMGDTTGSSASLLPSLPMLLGHVLAAVAAGWLLRRGDLAVLRLIELSAHGVTEGALVRSLRAALALAHALCAGLLPAAEPGPRGRRTARDEVPAPHTTALQHTVIRRGPPAAAFLLAA
ncbi:hypothetical protein AQI88_19325 [Streptomyces cellostaticus]|uniref:Integral membrane protein n=1 Tax=Streptomyces cellostaticus TaxID=67285 RepID=A0A117PWA6_9ACTN|nr:hypothetical protein [Streptomyces cellostaticus]KUM94987.1 hypothetical protein AQI88_19325 [Streptomyces cellostaticus]GHI06501.1 hypothetical protein Scel_48220 [Streptomyces cellostaticus]